MGRRRLISIYPRDSAGGFAATTPILPSRFAAASTSRHATAPVTLPISAFPPPYAPLDFAAWIEVYLGGEWHMFDPRNNAPRIGRVLIAHGRDAADVPLTHNFGPGTLSGLRVWAEEAPAG
jgi:transglutaminase-like putative cysteine protease